MFMYATPIQANVFGVPVSIWDWGRKLRDTVNPTQTNRHTTLTSRSSFSELNTSKAKLWVAKYPREGTKIRWFAWPICRAANLQCYYQLKSACLLSHAEVTGRSAAVTWRGYWWSHSCMRRSEVGESTGGKYQNEYSPHLHSNIV